MPQAKLDAISQSRQVLPFSSKKKRDFLLQLQLQKEVDRLAVLLDEVREQSARVQAAADAIGDKVLSEQLKDSSTLPQRNGEPAPVKMDARR
ncbi:MAG TPA: hypothetical protein VE866_01155 [Candidatus Binatia bacterium]|nr:hypothetical protein [Candidatus Binatia bacterium]